MAGPLDRAKAMVEALTAAGVNATADIGAAVASLPCVIIQPPRLVYDLAQGATATWRLALVASVPLGNAAAWAELDDMLDKTNAALGYDIERADPASYRLPTGGDPLPAYIATITEAVR